MKWTHVIIVCLLTQAALFAGFATKSSTGSNGTASNNPEGVVPSQLDSRGQIVDELRALNGRMDKLLDVLNSGKLQVKVAKSDEAEKDGVKELK